MCGTIVPNENVNTCTCVHVCTVRPVIHPCIYSVNESLIDIHTLIYHTCTCVRNLKTFDSDGLQVYTCTVTCRYFTQMMFWGMDIF